MTHMTRLSDLLAYADGEYEKVTRNASYVSLRHTSGGCWLHRAGGDLVREAVELLEAGLDLLRREEERS
jgi:hypothetical protein